MNEQNSNLPDDFSGDVPGGSLSSGDNSVVAGNVARLLAAAYQPEPVDGLFADRVRLAMHMALAASESARNRASEGANSQASLVAPAADTEAPPAIWKMAVALAIAASLAAAFFLLANPDRDARREQPIVIAKSQPIGEETRKDRPVEVKNIAESKDEIARRTIDAVNLGDVQVGVETAKKWATFNFVKAAPAPIATKLAVLTPGETVSTGRGERRLAALPDGSRVWLNEQSTITFDGQRNLSLASGEAFFEVAQLNDLARAPRLDDLESKDRNMGVSLRSGVQTADDVERYKEREDVLSKQKTPVSGLVVDRLTGVETRGIVPSGGAEAKSLGARFLVTTPHRRVEAKGTKFLVRVADGATNVVVAQGKVAVDGVRDLLTHGEQVLLSDARTSVAGVEPGPRPQLGSDLAFPSGASDETALKLAGLSYDVAPRVSHMLGWARELFETSAAPLVPESEYEGGALVTKDANGQDARLSLRKYHLDVHIEDGFARTTIDQTYFNHLASRQEGTFFFPLPPDASISRLAMYVNGKLMEGGMAERQHAAEVFESIKRKMQDPALLEWIDGSTFRMRVFPLEGREEKRIVMSYTQRLPSLYGKTTYRFPSGHNLGPVGLWTANVHVKKPGKTTWKSPTHTLAETRTDDELRLTTTGKDIKLERDVVVELSDAPVDAASQHAARFSLAKHEGAMYLQIRQRPELPRTVRHERRDWIVVVETSADRDPLLARAQIESVRAMLGNVEHEDTFTVFTAATRPTRLVDGMPLATGENVSQAIARLEDVQLIGALDLEATLAAIAPIAADCPNPHIVHFGSANAVLGAKDDALAAVATKALPAKAKYIGVGVGKRWNRALMKSLAARTGGYFTQINPDEDVRWRAFDLVATLNTPRLLDVRVADDAGREWLTFADAATDGEEVCAIVRLDGKQKSKPPTSVTIAGKLDGRAYQQTYPIAANVVVSGGKLGEGAGYLPRMWAKLEIGRLLAAGAAQHKERITELSKAMYVMSPFTSLLVLENEQMYKDYKVDRGRKDHWALYPCPESIEVVKEPLAGVNPAARPVVAETEKAKQEHQERERLLQTYRARNATVVQPRLMAGVASIPYFDATNFPFEVDNRWTEYGSDNGFNAADGPWDINNQRGKSGRVNSVAALPFITTFGVPSRGDGVSSFRQYLWSDEFAVAGSRRVQDFGPGRAVKLVPQLATNLNDYYFGSVTYNKLAAPQFSPPLLGNAAPIDEQMWLGNFDLLQHYAWDDMAQQRAVRYYLANGDRDSDGVMRLGRQQVADNYYLWAKPTFGDDGTTMLGRRAALGLDDYTYTNQAGQGLAGGGYGMKAYFDLYGQPPTQQDVEAFAANTTRFTDFGFDISGNQRAWARYDDNLGDVRLLRRLSESLSGQQRGAEPLRRNARDIAPLLGMTDLPDRIRIEYLEELDKVVINGDPQDVETVEKHLREMDESRVLGQIASGGGTTAGMSANRAYLNRANQWSWNGRFGRPTVDININGNGIADNAKGLSLGGDNGDYSRFFFERSEADFDSDGFADVPRASVHNGRMYWRTPRYGVPGNVNLNAIVEREALGAVAGRSDRSRWGWYQNQNLNFDYDGDLGGGNEEYVAPDVDQLFMSYVPYIAPVGDPPNLLRQKPNLAAVPTLSNYARCLLAYAPGMYTSPADRFAVMEAEMPDLRAKPAAIDPSARQMIDRARAAPWQIVRLPRMAPAEPLSLVVDGQGRYRYTNHTAEGLEEQVICDSRTEWRLYEELGVGARRNVSRFHRAGILTAIPWLVPPAEDLAMLGEVKRIDDQTVAVVRTIDFIETKKGKPVYGPALASTRHEMRMVFDATGRPAERQWWINGALVVRANYQADGRIAWHNAAGKLVASQKFDVAATTPPQLLPDTSKLVVLPLPWRQWGFGETAKLKDGKAFDYLKYTDDEAMAALAALLASDDASAIRELIARRFFGTPEQVETKKTPADRRLGFYTLLSAAGVNWQPDALVKKGGYFREAIPAAPLADFPNSPMAYVLALELGDRNIGHPLPAMRDVDERLVDRSLAATLVTLRRLAKAANEPAQVKTDWQSFMNFAERTRSPHLSIAMLQKLQDVLATENNGEETTKRWQAIAAAYDRWSKTPYWSSLARYEAARAWFRGGDRTQAQVRFIAWHREEIAQGRLPMIDDDFRQALFGEQQPNLESNHFVNVMQDAARRLNARGRHAMAIALSWQAYQLKQAPLGESILNATLGGVPAERARSVSLVASRMLWHTEQYDRADALVAPLLDDKCLGRSSQLWRFAADIAEKRGRLSVAATRGERVAELELAALAKEYDVATAVAPFQSLMQRYRTLATAIGTPVLSAPTSSTGGISVTSADSSSLVARVVRAADQWRTLAADPTDACLNAAGVLSTLGAKDLAWDYATTPIASQIDAAAPFATAARYFATQGEHDLAERAFKAALDAKRDDATVVWDYAQLLEKQGRFDAARSQYQRLATENWPAGSESLVEQAKRRATAK